MTTPGKAVCSFPGCERRHHSRGYCGGHNAQLRRGAELAPIQEKSRTDRDPLCTFPGCERPHAALGWCHGHWAQVKSGANLTPIHARTKNAAACTFPGCERETMARGWCGPHWQQWRRGGELHPIGERAKSTPPCKFPGCERDARAVGWCDAHRKQELRGSEMHPLGERPPAKRDTCRKGHEYGDDNTIVRTAASGREWRECRECRKIRDAERAAKVPRTKAPKPARTPKAAPTLPPGWNAKAKTTTRPITEQGGGGIRSLPPTPPITPELRAIALDKLAALDALDVAEYLFGTRHHDDNQPVTPTPRNPPPKWLPELEEALACGWLPVNVILGDLGILPETAVKTLQGCGRHDLARRIQRAVPMWTAA